MVSGAENAEVVPGDIPSLFGTLTTQRYHWDDIIRIIATVEGIDDYKALSKSKRRALVSESGLSPNTDVFFPERMFEFVVQSGVLC